MKCLFHHKEWDSDFILGFYVFTIFSLCQLFKMISTLDRERYKFKALSWTPAPPSTIKVFRCINPWIKVDPKSKSAFTQPDKQNLI